MVIIKTTATISDGKESISVTACAGIEKAGGMQLAQAFGAASSYARKYALNGLFAIDDTADADEINTHGQDTQKAIPAKAETKQWVQPNEKSTYENLIAAGWDGKSIKKTDTGRHYVETKKSLVLLSLKQYIAFTEKAE